jgi:hypothetical protein
MTDDIHNQLLKIHSRLDGIEHTQEVLVRADATRIWRQIEEAFDKEPVLADIYELVDGIRTQTQIVEALKAQGAAVNSPMTVSRSLKRLREELQIVIAIEGAGGQGTVHAKTGLHRILGMNRHIKAWRRKREKGAKA